MSKFIEGCHGRLAFMLHQLSSQNVEGIFIIITMVFLVKYLLHKYQDDDYGTPL